MISFKSFRPNTSSYHREVESAFETFSGKERFTDHAWTLGLSTKAAGEEKENYNKDALDHAFPVVVDTGHIGSIRAIKIVGKVLPDQP